MMDEWTGVPVGYGNGLADRPLPRPRKGTVLGELSQPSSEAFFDPWDRLCDQRFLG